MRWGVKSVDKIFKRMRKSSGKGEERMRGQQMREDGPSILRVLNVDEDRKAKIVLYIIW